MTVVPDKFANLETAREMICAAARRGAALAVLPEMFNCPYDNSLFRDYAEPLPGGATDAMLADAARTEGMWLVGGSIPELDPVTGRVYNSCGVYDPRGELVARHRKLHLFDVDLPGGVTFQESATLSAGNTLTVVPTPLLTLGVAICYDLRFPELSRLMALRGAELLVFPGAFNQVTGPAHWELLLRARAVDNQVFVAGVSPALNPGASYHAWGHSALVDPWGTVVAAASLGPELVVATIDRQRLRQVREQLPLLRHRRRDLYRVSGGSRGQEPG
jgi:predicted amidohydrolase